MRLTKSIGMILLAIWLILWGLMAVLSGLCDATHCHGGARDRSRDLNPAGSVSGSVSLPIVLMSDGNWQSALCDLQTPAGSGINIEWHTPEEKHTWTRTKTSYKASGLSSKAR